MSGMQDLDVSKLPQDSQSITQPEGAIPSKAVDRWVQGVHPHSGLQWLFIRGSF